MLTRKEVAESQAAAREYRAVLDERERMAADGDVDGIWEILTRPRPCAFDPSGLFPLLLKAVEARARRDPERFSAEALSKVVSLTTYLTLRSHYLLARGIEQFDNSSQGCGRVELPPTLAGRVLPQLLALHESLGQMLHTQASVARSWELTRAKRLETDRAEARAASKATGKARAKARRKPGPAAARVDGTHGGDGKPANRIAGLLGGLGLGADGVHGDG